MRGVHVAIKLSAVAIVCLLVCSSAPVLAARSGGRPFYEGATIRVIIPYSAGGGFDIYGRAVARYLERHLPGSRIYAENVPGGGGLIGTNTLYRAQPDGLTIGILNTTGMILAALTGREGVEFDIGRFSYLARITSEPRAFAVGVNTPFHSLQDILDSKRTLLVSSTGTGSDDYYAMVLELALLGIPYRIVAGYPGQTEANLAVIAGEVDATQASWSNLSHLTAEGEVRPIFFLASERQPDAPDVPTILEIAPPEREQVIRALVAVAEVDRTFAAPPGVPEDRLRVLREAFARVFSDPEFIAELQAAGRPINFLHGDQVAQLVADAVAGSEELSRVLKSLQ